MFDILTYDFFQYALIWGLLVSIIASFFWVFIVMRKEANITHSIANIIFLWVSVSIFISSNYYLFAFLFAIIASFLIFYVEKTNFITKESTKEIISQFWIAWWIFILSFLEYLQVDINTFLFWNILFINLVDLILLVLLCLFTCAIFYFFHKNFLSIIISKDIAISSWLKIDYYNIIFLFSLSIFIWLSIKIFWILLIWAFLIIPPNISKVLSKSLKQVFMLSILISIFSVIIWLWSSYAIWTSTWSTIVLILILIFIISLLYKKYLI